MDFIPKSKEETESMLKEIGIRSIENLFIDIPIEIRLPKDLNLGKPLSEPEVKRKITNVAKKNRIFKTSFLGAGSYNHYIPSTVPHLALRSEFYTAYTPYQAEISQGILQAIFEYQTMIADLTGMEAANASVYDGATALAEAAIMCVCKTKKSEILVSKTIHPEYRQVVQTYMNSKDIKVKEIGIKEGLTNLEHIEKNLTNNTAAILMQSPNFFGQIEDIRSLSDLAHEKKVLIVICITDPTCLGILTPPGSQGADIVVAEGQSFGNPQSYGGPYLGIMAASKDLMRFLPGRIVGQTVDSEGKLGYTLTLQAREQHIRREKACSNICSNQALNALAATIYLSSLGKEGFRKLANANLQKSHYLSNKLSEDVKLKFSENFYNEFVIEFHSEEKLRKVVAKLRQANIQPGLQLKIYYPELEKCMLLCVTEQNLKYELDEFVAVVK